MYHAIVFIKLTNPYMRLVHIPTGQIADVANKALAITPGAWGDTDIQLSYDSNIGGIPVTIPPWLPAGEFCMLFYDAASPADSDDVRIGKIIRWSGKDLSCLPIDI